MVPALRAFDDPGRSLAVLRPFKAGSKPIFALVAGVTWGKCRRMGGVSGKADMALEITKGYRRLVAEAEKEIETISAEQAVALHGNEDVIFVDLRDVRELWREGLIPDAFHCPRGLLEFWIDPDCVYYKDIFGCGKRFIFYCNLGWRSALAARVSQQMGLTPVAHIGGGFDAWIRAGGPVATIERRG
jgi:rhodanese-related sulfurtransferase